MVLSETATARRRLLRWYARHKRNLPWRRDQDPYRVWVSEVMLQQTQVVTVVPYYDRFTAAFPTLEALAAASPARVTKLWEGLGYYNRVHNLHRAVRIVRDDHQGAVPRDPETFRSLPGVGPYIAAAVLSIAYGRPLLVVDGNVKRVYARLTADDRPVDTTGFLADLRRIMGALLSRRSPGNFNQAVMELGALVCRRHGCDCARCPLRVGCAAFRRGLTERLPTVPPRRPVPHYEVGVVLLWRGPAFLIRRRPRRGHLAGLWELPGTSARSDETAGEAAERALRDDFGVSVDLSRELAAVNHAYSHFRITLRLFESHRGEAAVTREDPSIRWITPREIDLYAFPRANRTLFARVFGRPSAA